MAIAPPGFVVAPPSLPTAPRYGLLQTIEPVLLDDPHAWTGGVEFEFDLCTSVESFTDQCPPDHTNSTERDLEFCHADPFVIKSSFDCATVGRSVTEGFTIAKRRLLAWESHELERIFWTGDAANGPVNPSLANGNDHCGIEPVDLTPVSGVSPISLVSALAVLEEALTDVVPGGGIIHAPYGMAAYFARYHLLEREGPRYYSPTGFPIVFGAGYPGSGPGNEEAPEGTTYLFGTGPVGIWRSEQFMNPAEPSEAINRYRNDVTVFSERFYAVGFSCALYAARTCLV